MQTSGSLYLDSHSGSFVFGHNDDYSEEKEKKIIIRGHVNHQGNPMNISGISFLLQVKEVSDDFKYAKIKNPEPYQKDKESYCYGKAIFLKANKNVCPSEDCIHIDLLLTFVEFSYLKNILDKFFSGTIQLLVNIQVMGLEYGPGRPEFNQFPADQYLTVVGYQFIAHSKEMTI
jgi:hypothetical protein